MVMSKRLIADRSPAGMDAAVIEVQLLSANSSLDPIAPEV